MSAKRFLEVLENSGLLESRVLAELRRNLAETKGKVTPESMAKYLVEKGHLTKFQATKLVAKVAPSEEEPADSQAAKAKQKSDDDDLLSLAPIDDETEPIPPPKSPAAKPKPAQVLVPDETNEDETVILEDAGGLTPVEDAGTGLTPIGRAPAGLTPMGGIGSGLSPVGLEPTSLDPFGGAGLSDLGAADPFAFPGGQSTGKQLYVPRKKETRWDTKLMLGGGLSLLVFVLLGSFLLWNALATPAVELYEAAEKAYREAAYPEAKDRFQNFLDKHSGHENAGKARVRIYLIRIRLDVGDPERGLATAQEVLPLVVKEKEADLAREEFPLLLPQIPEGFVNRAKQAKDTTTREQLLAKAEEAMKLVNDPEVIPSSRRTLIQPQLHRINEDIGLVKRTINQEKELVTAIAEIGTAEEAGETVKAFQIYHKLLKDYPSLRDDVDLREAVARISARERSLVKIVEEPIAALNTEADRASEFRVVLASRAGGGEAKPQNPVATALAAGSAYGLDAASGQVLWSRFVGYATHGTPVRLSNQADADVLLVDRQRQELARIKARSGELVWRLPVGEDFSEPGISGPRLYVSTSKGRILEIDGNTGECKRHVVVPQKLAVAPAVVSDQPYIFQVGEHSNIYVLSAESLECVDVIYLGHRAGTIEVAPLILMGHVFLAENSASAARVHALKIRSEGDGPKLFPTQEPILTTGRVVVPLVVYNRRLLILTDRGEIRVFDVDKTKNERSVTDTGKLPATLNEPLMGYALADGTTLWIADNKLTKYTVQVTRKEITRDPTITLLGDTFVAPLQLFGNSLIHARRMAGSTGVSVACISVDNPRQVIWQTHLGVPAGRIAVNPATNEIVAISSGASLYQINGEVLKSGYNDTPVATAGGGSSLSFTQPIEFEKDVVAFFNPADNKQLLVYNPDPSSPRLRIVPLQLGDGKVPCTPVAFLGGLLVPADHGGVLLLKLSDGTNQVLPFQPKLEPDEKIQWRRPAVLGESGREFVIADDRKNIYRVGVKDQPSPHLAELGSNQLEVELASGLAVAGDTLYSVVRTNGGDAVVAISVAELKVIKEWDLQGGRVTWGPEQVGNTVMIVTDEKELRCYGPNQTERWEKPAVMHGQPAGRPLIDGDDYVFASIPGTVWRIAGATGQESAKAEVGEPLGAGPVAFRGRLLLCGNDGSLHVIPMPMPVAGSGS